MKEKINTIFKIVIIVAVLIITASVSYYFLTFLPYKEEAKIKQKEQEYLLSMKEKCQSLGQSLYQEDVKELGKNNMLLPEYYYNKELNTCLYASGYLQQNYFEKWIKDSLTNKTIVLFIQREIDGEWRAMKKSVCSECVSSSEEFEAQKQELFNE